MNTTYSRGGMSWGGRLLIALTLILAGAAAAAWALARYQNAAQVLGVVPAQPNVARAASLAPSAMVRAPADNAAAGDPEAQARVATLEARLARLENATQRVEGSAGRADALLVAFAARRAIDRGVALGYLETLLVDRFGAVHPGAVATIVTGSRDPILLADLVADYEKLAPNLRGGGPSEEILGSLGRQLSELAEIRRADQPSVKPQARYNRALDRLRSGEVNAALAETMRLPAAAQAQTWIAEARRYVAVQRALDEVESAALLSGGQRG